MKGLTTICSLFYIIVQTTGSDVINFSLPENTVKLSTQQFTQFSKSKLKISTLDNDTRAHYQNGDIILAFWDAVRPLFTERTLESKQKVSASILKRTKKNAAIKRSEIITVNNIRYLIFQYEVNDSGKIIFNSDYYNDKNLRGELTYNFADRDKANELLNQILNSSKLR
ncbi:hypothetical protein [Mucilaginibacter defluvii]|uniref:DUF4468 domain-containing protein n=1 Tax=Mucilaginibacter defluvii TaxID=1196019 RepID=A0ABP9FK16_9SPHI